MIGFTHRIRYREGAKWFVSEIPDNCLGLRSTTPGTWWIRQFILVIIDRCILMLDRVIEMGFLTAELLSTLKEDVRNALSVL